MAPITKHGGHRIILSLPALGAGSSSDTSALFAYDYLYSTYGVYDGAFDTIVRGTLVLAAAVTGANTNNFAAQMTHYNVSGSVVDQVAFTFASGTNATAYVPIDVTPTAAGTGSTIRAGWQIASGDSIELKRLTNGTGLSSPAIGLTLLLGAKGA